MTGAEPSRPMLPVLRGPLAGRYVADDGYRIALEVPIEGPDWPRMRYVLRAFPSLDGLRYGYAWLPEGDDPLDLTLAEVHQLQGWLGGGGHRQMPVDQVEHAAQTARQVLVSALKRAAVDAEQRGRS